MLQESAGTMTWRLPGSQTRGPRAKYPRSTHGPSAMIGRVDVELVVAGAVQDQAAVEHALKHALDAAFEADAGELRIVLTAQSDGYVVFFARAILEHTMVGLDYSEEVRAALERSGVAVVRAGVSSG
jgi:hypothetical protein